MRSATFRAGSGCGGGGGGGGAANPPELLYTILMPNALILDVDLSADGSTVVFVGTDNPFRTNIDGNQEIFAIDVATGAVVQVTSELIATLTIDLTADGSEVAFHSELNYSGGNASLDPNVFLAATDGRALVQITFGVFDPQWIRLSADGTRLTFQSDSNPFGANNDGLNEIQVMNVNGTGHMQLTQSSSQGSITPEISADGELIAIASAADLIAGSNPAFDRQIFVLRADGTGTLQITSGDADSSAPDISGDGAFVVFESLADLTGDKPTTFPNDSTIFWARTDGTGLTEVLTDDRLDDPDAFEDTRLATMPEISGDGSLIVFVSPLNYTSGATGARQKIYLIER